MTFCFYITILLLKDVLSVALLLRGADTFRIFDQIGVLTQGGPGTSTQSLTVLIYESSFRYLNIGRASAMSIVMLLVLLIILYVLIKRIRLVRS